MYRYLLSLFLLFIPSVASASAWLIDTSQSTIRFRLSNFAVSSIEGVFHRFDGTARLDERDMTRSTLSLTIHVASVDTGNAERDEELRSSRFLDVASYPTATFTSGRIAKSREGLLVMRGELVMHGVGREIIIHVKGPGKGVRDHRGRLRRRASATTTISRRAFGLDWTELMTAALGDEIRIDLDIWLLRR